MRRPHLLKVAALLGGISALLFGGLWAWSAQPDDGAVPFQLGNDLHATLDGSEVRITNNVGSADLFRRLEEPTVIPRNDLARNSRWSALGLSYRYARFRDGDVYWAWRVSLLTPLFAAATAMALSVILRVRRKGHDVARPTTEAAAAGWRG